MSIKAQSVKIFLLFLQLFLQKKVEIVGLFQEKGREK